MSPPGDTTAPAEREPERSQTLDRGLAVLGLLAEREHGATVSEPGRAARGRPARRLPAAGDAGAPAGSRPAAPTAAPASASAC
nr:hypothetical protein [Angustibacter aerolatus]